MRVVSGVLLLGAGLLSGCGLVEDVGGLGGPTYVGGEDSRWHAARVQPPAIEGEDLNDLVREGMDAAGTVHVDYTENAEGVVYRADLAVAADGSCEGTVTIAGAEFDLRSIEGTQWTRGDEEAWLTALEATGTPVQKERAALVAPVLAGSWVENDVPGPDPCDVTGTYLANLLPDGPLRVTEGARAGVGTWQFYSADQAGPTLWLEADEPHRLVEMSWGGTITARFGDFGEPVDVRPPPPDEVIAAPGDTAGA